MTVLDFVSVAQRRARSRVGKAIPCAVCGKPLKAPESIARGYGPSHTPAEIAGAGIVTRAMVEPRTVEEAVEAHNLEWGIQDLSNVVTGDPRLFDPEQYVRFDQYGFDTGGFQPEMTVGTTDSGWRDVTFNLEYIPNVDRDQQIEAMRYTLKAILAEDLAKTGEDMGTPDRPWTLMNVDEDVYDGTLKDQRIRYRLNLADDEQSREDFAEAVRNAAYYNSTLSFMASGYQEPLGLGLRHGDRDSAYDEAVEEVEREEEQRRREEDYDESNDYVDWEGDTGQAAPIGRFYGQWDEDGNHASDETLEMLENELGGPYDDPYGGSWSISFESYATYNKNEIGWRGRIMDEDGNQVGELMRTLNLETGDIHHDLFKIYDDETRGQGFGTEFIARSIELYVKNGVKTVSVQANIDVGGYAWARMGFDFAEGLPPFATRNAFDDLLAGGVDVFERPGIGQEAVHRKVPVPPDFAAEIRAAFDPPNFSAFTISQLGRRYFKEHPDDEFVQAWWRSGHQELPGKEFMLSTSWPGVLRLDEFAEPGAPPSKVKIKEKLKKSSPSQRDIFLTHVEWVRRCLEDYGEEAWDDGHEPRIPGFSDYNEHYLTVDAPDEAEELWDEMIGETDAGS